MIKGSCGAGCVELHSTLIELVALHVNASALSSKMSLWRADPAASEMSLTGELQMLATAQTHFLQTDAEKAPFWESATFIIHRQSTMKHDNHLGSFCKFSIFLFWIFFRSKRKREIGKCYYLWTAKGIRNCYSLLESFCFVFPPEDMLSKTEKSLTSEPRRCWYWCGLYCCRTKHEAPLRRSGRTNLNICHKYLN